MLAFWRFVVHVLGVDYQAPYGHWVWYNFWSGVAGSFLVGLAVFAATRWSHGTCHHSFWCWRRGRHEAAGGVFKLCWKHHPDMGTRPHPRLIHELHHAWKRGQPA